MHHTKTVKDYLWEYFLIIVGSVLYAAGLRFFFYPNDIIAGGVTGIAMIINYLTDIPVGVMNLIINIPLFIWAWKGFGLKFIVGSFVATVLSSVFVDLYAPISASWRRRTCCWRRSTAACSTASASAWSTARATPRAA